MRRGCLVDSSIYEFPSCPHRPGLPNLPRGSLGEKLNDWNMIGPPEGFVGSYGNHVGIIWVSFGNHFENIATKQ